MPAPELVFDGRHGLAEGPVWRHGSLFWVNITSGELHRIDPSSGLHEKRTIGGDAGCAVCCEDGRWLVARDRELLYLDWETGATTPFCAVEPEMSGNRFNDGQCDPRGRLWAGTMDKAAAGAVGSLYVIEAGRGPRRALEGLTISNGMAWSPDGRAFYFTDTATRRVDVYDFDSRSGNISNRRTLAAFSPGECPDGMAMDAEGNLWIALWGAWAVVCLDGQTGREMRRIRVPASRPTSCAFGGPDLDELFITTARTDLPASALEREPQAGGIFRVRPGVRGRPGAVFKSSPEAGSHRKQMLERKEYP